MTQLFLSDRPVSATLEAVLQSFVRRNGVVVWLDADDHYSAFVDRLIEAREAGSMKYDLPARTGRRSAWLPHAAPRARTVASALHGPC